MCVCVCAKCQVGPKRRMVAGTLCHYAYTVGYFVMAGIAYFLNDDWQMLQVAYCCSAPLAYPTGLLVPFFPEQTEKKKMRRWRMVV